MRTNNYIFITLLFSSFSLLSQSLDEDFINSLPSNIKDDVLDEANKSGEKPDYIYRSPNTKQELPFQTLERLVREIDEVKKKYAAKDIDDNELKRFGDSFFSSIQSSFMPINDPSFSSGYIINPGDRLKLQIIGSNSKITDIQVEREGSINIPNVGKIFVVGLEISKAQDLIDAQVKQKLPGSNSFLTLTGISDIQILIVGNVINPGLYAISGNTNILHALDAAGGIAENGSFRNIQVKRNNELIANVDLYDIFINGNISQEFQLKSGDSIVVGPLLPQIAISGAISNPAIYEIKEFSLGSAIKLAQGLTPNFSAEENIKISRKNFNSEISVPIDKDTRDKFELIAGDNIFVPNYKPVTEKSRSVKIHGFVNNPGTYFLKEDDRLLDVIYKAGGYKINAYPLGGIFTRLSVKKIEEETNKRIYKDLISFLVNNLGKNTSGNSGGDSSIAMLISEYKDSKTIGRMSVELDIDVLNDNPKLNIQVHDGDEIYIPSINSNVFVFGEVMNPGTRMYQDDNNIFDYVDESGGLTKHALKKNIIIINPNGNASNVNPGLLSFQNSTEYILPGSLIYVPRDIDPVADLQSTALFSQVFSSLALSLASLNSIN
tara:strand:- start:2151 stop:3965 length:1815 start_codon:yes stop_codon:yes gene_type:complete